MVRRSAKRKLSLLKSGWGENVFWSFHRGIINSLNSYSYCLRETSTFPVPKSLLLWFHQISQKRRTMCKGTVSGSGTGPLGYGSGTGHRGTPIWTVSGSGSLWNNYSARLGIRGWVSVPARIWSNCYFTNKNSCWSFTICIYCHTIQTSISLYKRYKIFNGQEWKKNITIYNLSYFFPIIFIFLILIFFNKVMNKGN